MRCSRINGTEEALLSFVARGEGLGSMVGVLSFFLGRIRGGAINILARYGHHSWVGQWGTTRRPVALSSCAFSALSE